MPRQSEKKDEDDGTDLGSIEGRGFLFSKTTKKTWHIRTKGWRKGGKVKGFTPEKLKTLIL